MRQPHPGAPFRVLLGEALAALQVPVGDGGHLKTRTKPTTVTCHAGNTLRHGHRLLESSLLSLAQKPPGAEGDSVHSWLCDADEWVSSGPLQCRSAISVRPLLSLTPKLQRLARRLPFSSPTRSCAHDRGCDIPDAHALPVHGHGNELVASSPKALSALCSRYQLNPMQPKHLDSVWLSTAFQVQADKHQRISRGFEMLGCYVMARGLQ